MINSAQSFEELPLPRRDYPGGLACNYKVYKDPENFVTVTASTALEALQRSGIGAAYKIMRDSIDYNKVLDLEDWFAPAPQPEGEAGSVQAPNAQLAAQQDPAQATAEATSAASQEEAVLSSEDVNNLLSK